MSFSRTDEIDLLTVLHEGPHEEPRWATFLARLLRRTRADNVTLIVGQGDLPIHEAPQWSAGRDVRTKADQLRDLTALDPTPYHRLRPGRVYSATELINPDDAAQDRFRREYLERIGVRHGRFMRVTERSGGNGWLSVIRSASDFTAADSALLSALAPHLSIALRTFGELEQARFRQAVAADALARAGIGWVALERDGATVDMFNAPAIPLVTASRLSHAGAGALRIDAEPAADFVVVPVPTRPTATARMPTVIALTRRPPRLAPRVAAVLEQLFGLTPGEAKLAVLIAGGESLAEAAVALGLTLETARNYSKRLFAKTGTRGQADLVRLVLTSAASLA